MNKKFMALAALLVAVVGTGFQVSGTYAKYTTTENFSDSARVAHWDFYSADEDGNKRTENTIDLFRDSYTCVAGGNCVFNTQNDNKNLVAPGTYGEYTFSLKGETEVAYRLVVKDNGITNTVKLADEGYDPIRFSLDKNASDENWFGSDELVEKLQAYFNKNNTDYVYTNGVMDQEVTLYWKWNYSVDADFDVLDTKLGNTFKAGNDPEISISLTISAVQAEIDQTL